MVSQSRHSTGLICVMDRIEHASGMVLCTVVPVLETEPVLDCDNDGPIGFQIILRLQGTARSGLCSINFGEYSSSDERDEVNFSSSELFEIIAHDMDIVMAPHRPAMQSAEGRFYGDNLCPVSPR